jgi:SSS family solute:Na+ symporter
MTYLNKINIYDQLSILDWSVFFGTILITLGFAVVSYRLRERNRTHNSALEYILMGRQLTLPLFVATLVSTWYGGIIGVTQIAFEKGIYNFVTQGLFWYISYIIFAIFLVIKIRQSDVLTLPELVEKTIGKRSAKLTAVFVFFKTLPITYIISLGVFLELILQTPFFVSILIGTGFVIFYSLFGGFRAVVYSDFFQFLLMFSGVISVVVFSVVQFGGYSFLANKLPATHFAFFGDCSVSSSLVWLFIACSTTFTNPTFYQRCLAAKDNITATKGIFISMGFWFVFDCCTTLGAMYARAVIPEANSLDAYLIYALQLLPTGLKGLLIASIAATILSTLDSFLLVSSTALSHDIFKKEGAFKHNIFIIITGILAVLIAWKFEGRLEVIWKIVKGYFASSLLIPILLVLNTKATIPDRTFVVISLLSVSATTVWIYAGIDKTYDIDPFYIGVSTSCVLFIGWFLQTSFARRFPLYSRK